MLSWVTKLMQFARDIIYNRSCAFCQQPIILQHALCQDCFAQVHVIHRPKCIRCGEAFLVAHWEECPHCYKTKLYYQQAVAVFVYQGLVREMLHKFKFNAQLYLGKFFAYSMYLYYRQYMQQVDVIVPIPMSNKKLKARGYNQAVIIAKHLAQILQVPMLFALHSKEGKYAQHRYNYQDRITNARTKFYCPKPNLVKGLRVLIVDDVITTGATVNQAAYLLHKHAKNIKVIAAAKTPKIYF